jgi:hypothetical protein
MVLVVLLVMTMALTGCAGSTTRSELERALTDTRAAVTSTRIAVQLLGQGRISRSAAEVTSSEMVDQVGLVQQRLAGVPADTLALRDLRQRSQQVVTVAMVALQDSEDVLGGAGSTAAVAHELTAVTADLDEVTTMVEGR